MASGWRTVGISLFCVLPTLHLAGIIAVVLQPFAAPAPFEGQSVELESTGDQIYYEKPVSSSKAKKAGEYLHAVGYLNKRVEQAVKLQRSDTHYTLLLPVNYNFYQTRTLREVVESTIIDLSDDDRVGGSVQVRVLSVDSTGKRVQKTFARSDF